MNRISGWKRGVATGVEFFANDSGYLRRAKNILLRDDHKGVS